MSHAVVFSDIHLDNWDAFHRIDPGSGLNTRMLDGIRILEQIRDYCVKKKISLILFGGDMFHSSKHLWPDLLERFLYLMWDITRNHGISIMALPGQHDHYAQDGMINALAPFRFLFTVMDRVDGWSPIGYPDINIISCPDRKNLYDLKDSLKAAQVHVDKKRKNIFMGHFLIKEIMKADGVQYEANNVEIADLPKGCDIYLFGDYHPHVFLQKQKMVSIGATGHHVFAPNNRPQGGFLDLDLETMTFKRIETNAPMFIKVSADEDFPGEYDPKNFYAIEVRDNQREARVRSGLDETWNVSFPVISDEKEGDEEESRLGLQISMAPEEVIARYCEYMGKDLECFERGLSYL